MLGERDRRLLASVVDILMTDFDPKEATSFLHCKELLSDSDLEMIHSKPVRHEQICELLRIYRRRAENLCMLIEYFDLMQQEHIVAALKGDTVPSGYLRPDIVESESMTKEKRSRLLLNGQVPSVARNHIERVNEISQIAHALRSRADASSYFVVLHGMPGCGKTALVSSVLSTVPDLIGGVYHSVCFLQESAKSEEMVKYTFGDLLIMLLDDVDKLIHPPNIETTSKVSLMKQIQNALIDRPDALIVLDDVRQVETVRWAERLGLRVLATTRNASLFDAAQSPVDIIHIDGFSHKDSMEYILKCGVSKTATPTKTNRGMFSSLLYRITSPMPTTLDTSAVMEMAYAASSGNPAVLGKLCKLAAGRVDRLSIYTNYLRERGLASLTCSTSYHEDNLQVAFRDAIDTLEPIEQAALGAAAIMPTDQWVPNEAWVPAIPVDVCGWSDGSAEVYQVLTRLAAQGAWVTEREDGEWFKVPAIVHLFLVHTIDKEPLTAVKNNYRVAVTDLLRSVGEHHPASGDAHLRPELTNFFDRNMDWFTSLR